MPDANPTLADRAWLERRYRHDRAPVATIAAEAGVDRATVHRALTRHGIPLRGVTGRRTLAGVSDRTVLTAVRQAESSRAAARALSVDKDTLRARLQAMGRVPMTDPDGLAAEIAAAYASGASREALAEQHGMSVRTVSRRLAAAGVEPRPRGRRAR